MSTGSARGNRVTKLEAAEKAGFGSLKKPNKLGPGTPSRYDSATEQSIAGKSSLEVSLITSDGQFDELASEWDRLVKESDCTFFQTFEWQRTWWKYYGKTRELHTLVFKNNGEIVGIAPMYRERVSLLGIRVAIVLRFFSEWYVDLIAIPSKREEVVRMLVTYLSSVFKEWDIFEMSDVNERFPVWKLVPGYLKELGMKTLASYVGS